MKKLLILLLFSTLFLSCLTQKRAVESGDGFKKIESIRLTQTLVATFEGMSPYQSFPESFPLRTTFFYQWKEGLESAITMEMEGKIPGASEGPDSVFYWNLDGELIGVELDLHKNLEENSPDKVGIEVKIPESKSHLMILHFTIPHSLWISIVSNDKIGYRVHVGNEKYNVHIPEKSKKRLKHFFELALEKEEQKAPVIPEGQMRW